MLDFVRLVDEVNVRLAHLALQEGTRSVTCRCAKQSHEFNRTEIEWFSNCY